MKLILSFILCFFIAEGIAQTEAVYLKTQKNENRLEFWVYNTTNDPIEVTLDLYNVRNLRGKKKGTKASVPANGTALVKKMKIKGDYSYNYELKKSYSEKTLAIKERKIDNLNLKEGIVFFNKPGCPRCQFLLSFLMENDIDFQLVDLNNRKNKKFMYKLLEESGVTEKRVMTPVVVVDEEVSYSHENLEAFANTLK